MSFLTFCLQWADQLIFRGSWYVITSGALFIFPEISICWNVKLNTIIFLLLSIYDHCAKGNYILFKNKRKRWRDFLSSSFKTRTISRNLGRLSGAILFIGIIQGRTNGLGVFFFCLFWKMLKCRGSISRNESAASDCVLEFEVLRVNADDWKFATQRGWTCWVAIPIFQESTHDFCRQRIISR